MSFALWSFLAHRVDPMPPTDILMLLGFDGREESLIAGQRGFLVGLKTCHSSSLM